MASISFPFRTALLAAILLTLAVGSASAQPASGPSVGLSYSFLDITEEDDLSLPAGWLVSFAQPVARSPFSLVGEMAGNYRSEDSDLVHLHTFQGGLRVNGRGPVTPWAQMLAGVMTVGCCGESEGYFSIEPGGGVDIPLSRRASLRLGASFPMAFYEGEVGETFRFQAGVTFPLGR